MNRGVKQLRKVIYRPNFARCVIVRFPGEKNGSVTGIRLYIAASGVGDEA